MGGLEALDAVRWEKQNSKKKSHPQSGSNNKSSFYDTLDITLSQIFALMRHSTANPKPKTLNPKP